MNETTNGLSDDSRIAHYRIVSKIGAGMGEVYPARKDALKLLTEKIAKDKDRLRRFEQ